MVKRFEREISGGHVSVGDNLTLLGKSGVSSPTERLESFPRPTNISQVEMVSDEVTALCPVTGQPDQYTVEIYYLPDSRCIESKSLKLKLQSYRNEGLFCEQFASDIVNHVVESIDPIEVTVKITQKPRGGVGIVAQASHQKIPCTPGIYRIINLYTRQFYIGSAVNLQRRWYEHRRELGLGIHYNSHLQRAWNKYGGQGFIFEILETVDILDNLYLREECWIGMTNATDQHFGYNLSRFPSKGTLGIHWNHSEETKRKISEAGKGHLSYHKPDTGQKISRALKGRVPTEEEKRKSSEARKGVKRGPYKKPTAQAGRSKIGEAAKGHKKSDETKRKMSISMKSKNKR